MEDGEQRQFRLPTSAHTLYEAYCDIRLAPVSASPFDDDDDSEGSAQQPAAAGDDGDAGDTGDEQQPVAGALCGPVPLAEINPIETATPLSQKEFFEETLLEIMHGDRPPYTEWNRLEVTPPDPLCGTCKTSDAAGGSKCVKHAYFRCGIDHILSYLLHRSCRPSHILPEVSLSLKLGQFLILFSVNIFSLSIIGAKLKAENPASCAALRSSACGGALRRCAAPSAAARRSAPPLRGATRPARSARNLSGTMKKKPRFQTLSVTRRRRL